MDRLRGAIYIMLCVICVSCGGGENGGSKDHMDTTNRENLHIYIVSPIDGEIFTLGDEIVLEVECASKCPPFQWVADGHKYESDNVVFKNGLSVGSHNIALFNDLDEELDAVTITVESIADAILQLPDTGQDYNHDIIGDEVYIA